MPPYIKTIFLAAQNNSDCYYYNNIDQSGRLYYAGGDQVNGPIYDQGSYLSFGFPLSSPLTVYITVILPDGDSTENVALQLAEGSLGNNVTCSITWSGQGDGCQAFTAKFQPEKFGTPWSIVQSLSWTITVNGGAPIPLSSSTFIEGYGILMDQPRYLQTEGIPVQLLRLFNRPSINGVLQTEQDWISWVTHVVHGTQDPNGTPLQFRSDSTQHWLRYNVWTGARSFIGENGGAFDLEGWLDTYSSPVTKLVNCFDQAAIVLVTLGLGLDWKRLQWEILAPFGYISADLTGWGQTNSPFFEADDQNKAFTDVADPMRTPFRSHVFVGISPTLPYDQSSAVIADACAGPVYGNKSYAVYKTENALGDGLKVLTQGHSAPGKPWGITSTVVEESNPKRLDDWIVWWMRGKEGKQQGLDSVVGQLRSAFTDSPTVSSTFDAETVIMDILQPILDKDDSSFILADQSPLKTTVNGTDASILTNGTTTRRTIAGYVTNKGDPAYILFQITTFPGLEDALSGLQQRLGRFTWPSAWKADNLVNILPAPTDPDDVISDQRAMILGGSHVSIFLYKNTIVELGGNSLGTQDMMPAWVKDFWTLLSEY